MIIITVRAIGRGTSVKDLFLTHQNCSEGAINVRSIKATVGESTDSSEVEELVELKCKSCGKKIWLQKRVGDTADLLNAAVKGRQCELSVFEGKIKPLEYRDFDNLIGERTQMELIPEIVEESEFTVENLVSGGEVQMDNIQPVVDVVKGLVENLYSQGEGFWGTASRAEISNMSLGRDSQIIVQVTIELETEVQKQITVTVDDSGEEPEISSFEVSPR